MRKFVIVSICDKTTTLRCERHLITDQPLQYETDTILATYYRGYGELIVFESLEEAKRFETGKLSRPIFEVELTDERDLKYKRTQEIRHGSLVQISLMSSDKVKRVVSAYHADKKYQDLSHSCAQRERLISGLRQLNEGNFDGDSKLGLSILNLQKLLGSLHGKLSYSDLAEIIEETNALFDGCTFKLNDQGKRVGVKNLKEHALRDYKLSAKNKQGAPSPAMQALGVCMMAVAMTVMVEVALVPGLIIALTSLGMYSLGRESSVCKAMNNISRLIDTP